MRRLPCLLLAMALCTHTPAQAAGPFAYVPNYSSNTVSVIDTGNYTVVATIPVGQNPQGVAVNGHGTTVYVSNVGSGTVSAIDVATNTVFSTIPVGDQPRGIVVHPRYRRAYVSLAAGWVAVIDTVTNTVTDYIAVDPEPDVLALDTAGTRLWVVHPYGSVTLINAEFDTDINRFFMTDPRGVALSPDGRRAYVTTKLAGHSIVVLDTANGSEISSSGPVPEARLPAFNPSGTRLYVATYDDDLCALDTTHEPPVLEYCVHPGYTISGVNVSADGTRLLTLDRWGGQLHAYDLAVEPLGTPVATVAVGTTPGSAGPFLTVTAGRDATAATGTWAGTWQSGGFLLGTSTYANAPFNVFGTTVDLGAVLGTQSFLGLLTDVEPGPSRHFDAVSGFSFEGRASCDEPCTNDSFTVDAAVTNPDGVLPAGFRYRLVGSIHGASDFNGTSPVGYSGTFEIHAIAPANTPLGSNVTVTGGTATVPVTVTYGGVTTPGTTVIASVPNPEGVVPSNFAIAIAGVSMQGITFFDISTDAGFTPPIRICIGYDPRDADIFDFLVIGHAANGVYHAEPTTNDRVNHRICAEVNSLSPFVLAPLGPARSGFVPPDSVTSRCERGVAKAVGKLAVAIANCHVAAAAGAFAGQPTDEATCVSTARAAYDVAVGRLSGCPVCIAGNATRIRDEAAGLTNALDGASYCAGVTPFSSSTLGRVPPDRTSAACAKRATKAAAKRANALLRCHAKAAAAVPAGRPINVATCEVKAAAGFGALKLTGCPACLVDGIFALGAQVEASLDRRNGDIYCAGTTPFP